MFEWLEARATPTVVFTWTGLGNYPYWNDGSNWDQQGRVPGPCDDAVIGDGGADAFVVVKGTASVKKLESHVASLVIEGGSHLSLAAPSSASGNLALLDGSMLEGPGSLDLGGQMRLYPGTHLGLSGTTTILATGGLSVPTSNSEVYLDAGKLRNEGTATLSNATFRVATEASIENAGNWTLKNSGIYGPSTFANEGTLATDVSNGDSDILLSIFNTGDISHIAGSLRLGRVGKFSSTNHDLVTGPSTSLSLEGDWLLPRDVSAGTLIFRNPGGVPTVVEGALTTSGHVGVDATVRVIGSFEVASVGVSDRLLLDGSSAHIRGDVTLNYYAQLGGAGHLEIGGMLRMYPGSRLAVAAGVTLTPSGSLVLPDRNSVHIDAGTLRNEGSVMLSGSILLGPAAAIENAGTWTLRNGGISSGAGFTNQPGATLATATDSVVAAVGTRVVNHGTIDHRAGNLQLGGLNAGLSSTDTSLITNSEASLELTGDWTVGGDIATDTVSFRNPGGVPTVVEGTLTVAAHVGLDATVRVKGAFHTASIGIGGGCQLLLDGPSTVAGDVTLHPYYAQLGGAGQLDIGGMLRMYPGSRLAVAAGVTLTASGSLVLPDRGDVYLEAGMLRNEGTLTQSGSILLGPTAEIVNVGTWTLRNGGISSGAGFTNQPGATLATAADSSGADVSARVVNHGTIDHSAGYLRLSNGGSSDGVVEGAPGTFLELTGAWLLPGGASVGYLTISNRNGTAVEFGGALSATSEVVVDESTSVVVRGDYFASGTRLAPFASVEVFGSYSASRTTLVSNVQLSLFGNRNSLSSVFQRDHSRLWFGAATRATSSAGTYYLEGNSTIDGNTDLTIEADFFWTASTVAIDGTLTILGAADVSLGATLARGTLMATGPVTSSDGTGLRIGEGGAIAPSATPGTTAPPFPIYLERGILQGSGTLNASVTNAGTVSPGEGYDPGVIELLGDYRQTSAGRLAISVGSPPSRLAVHGRVTLAGTLDVHLGSSGALPADETIIILDNQVPQQPIDGAFNGLGECQEFDIYQAHFPYALEGSYRITYQGGDGNDVALTVLNNPPIGLTLVADPATVVKGAKLYLSGSFLDPDAGQVHRVKIEWGDGQVREWDLRPGCLTFDQLDHTYNPSDPSGLFPVIQVTVTDAKGASTRSRLTVQVLDTAEPSTLLTSSVGTSVFGQTVTFTATMSATDGVTPTGIVEFWDDGNLEFNDDDVLLDIGGLSNGVATIQVSWLPSGNYTITARYRGDNYFRRSTSTPLDHVVTEAATRVDVAPLPSPITYGQELTITATVSVSPRDPNAPTPTGLVQLLEGLIGDQTIVATGVLSRGVAVFSTRPSTESSLIPHLSAGIHVLTVNYLGDHENDGGYLGRATFALSMSAGLSQEVQPATLRASVLVSDKMYDGKTTATISAGWLSGVVGGDDVTLIGGTAAFDTKNVGTHKTVKITGLSLIGADTANYRLYSDSFEWFANITPRPLAVTATGINRVYDRTILASVALADNRVLGDVLMTRYTFATFNDRNVGVNKPVEVTGISVSGTDAPNYTLTTTTAYTTAAITPKPLTGSIAANQKEYDGKTAATIKTWTLAGVVPGDLVSYDFAYSIVTFADKNVGNAKTVNAIGLGLIGADAGNYTVNSTATATAKITPKPLTGSITAGDRVYDGTKAATIITSTLAGVIDADDVRYDYSGATATFADKNVGNAKPVSATGLSLFGTDKGNYTVNTKADTTASISPRPITVTADARTKAYGTADPALTYQVTAGSLASGDSFSGGLTRDPGESPGTYPIRQGTLNAGGNYALTYFGAALTIKAATKTTLRASSTSVAVGLPVTFTATVDASPSGTPTGLVTFMDGSVRLGTGTLNPDRVATLTISFASHGNHSVTAVYGGSAAVAGSTSAALTVKVAKKLVAAGGPAPGPASGPPLSASQVQPLVDAALDLWLRAGAEPARVAALRNVAIKVVDLPGADLGASMPGEIDLDRDAAGYGWSIDQTPLDDSEFRRVRGPVRRHVNLLSVIAHELGHQLGLDHDTSDDVMHETLSVGLRRLPTPSIAIGLSRAQGVPISSARGASTADFRTPENH